MSLTARIMENTLAYRLWMAPFAEKIFHPSSRTTTSAARRSMLGFHNPW